MAGPPSSVFRSVRRPPRRRWLRTLKLAVWGLLVVGVLMLLLVAGLWGEAWLRLGGTEVEALGGDVAALGPQGAQAPEGATTVLVVPVEEHEPTRRRPAPLAGPVALVQAGGPREGTYVVLLPPQLRIAVEGEGDLTLAEAHREHGLDALVRGVVDYSSVAIDHVAVPSIDLLPRLTDALGGVEHCEGGRCRSLQADEVREATTSGPLHERTVAAVEAVAAIADDLDATTPLRSPLATRRVVTAVDAEARTDVSLRGARLLRVAGALADPEPLTVSVVPGVVNPDTQQLVVRPEQAAALFQHLQQGTTAEGDATAGAGASLSEDVRIAVANAVGTAGLAARVESQLESGGVPVATTGNAATFDAEVTEVAFAADDPEAEIAAILVAEQLGADVTLEPRDRTPSLEGEPVDVLVVAGQDLDDEGSD